MSEALEPSFKGSQIHCKQESVYDTRDLLEYFYLWEIDEQCFASTAVVETVSNVIAAFRKGITDLDRSYK